VLTIAIPWPRSKPFQNQAAVNRNPRANFLDFESRQPAELSIRSSFP
jgi:hypothetical protein